MHQIPYRIDILMSSDSLRFGSAAAAGLARLLCIITPFLKTHRGLERRRRYPLEVLLGERRPLDKLLDSENPFSFDRQTRLAFLASVVYL